MLVNYHFILVYVKTNNDHQQELNINYTYLLTKNMKVISKKYYNVLPSFRNNSNKYIFFL